VTTTLDFGSLLERLPEGVIVFDQRGRCVHGNPAVLDLLGLDRDDLVGLRLADVVVASAGRFPGLGELAESGPWHGRVEIRRKDRRTAPADVTAAAAEHLGGPVMICTMRPVVHRPWPEAISAVQFTVAEILAQAQTPDEAAPRLLGALAEQLGWDTAEFWVVEEDRRTLRTAGVWATSELDLGEFERITRELKLGRGDPLPGSAWEADGPVWIEDGLARMPFVRQAVAVGQGLNTAFAVPIRHPEEGIVGVLAFFARGRRPEDGELLRALEPLTAQVGHFLHRRRIEQALRVSRDQLQALLEGVDNGITVQAPDGSLVFANQGAALAIGFDSPEELVAAPVAEVMARFEVFDEEGRPFPLDRLPGRRALTGERNAGELVRFRVVATGEERWSYVSASPILDENGDVQFAVNIFQDVTDRRRTEEGQRFLGEASAILASSLDYQTTLDEVAKLAVRRLADWCVVYVRDREDLQQLVMAHADPAMAPAAEEIQGRYPFSARRSQAIVEVARTGRSVLVPEITDEDLAASAVDEAHLEALRGLGFRSAIVAPMRSGNETLGVIVFVSSGSGRRYDQRDLELAEELGRRAGVAVDQARIHEERGHVAMTLQRSLLPPETPVIPGLEVATRYRPAIHDIAGDFYDVFPMGEGEWGVMIGDVCGKGAAAAALTSAARYTVHAAAIEHREPVAILSVLNEALLRQDLDGRFCTMLFAAVRPGDGAADVTLATGGHPSPFVLRADGSVEVIDARGSLLGVVSDPAIGQVSVRLDTGDAAILYTDGLADGGIVDDEVLASELEHLAGRSAEDIAKALESSLPAEQGQLRDDLAILVFRVAPASR
jgi:PAS domain S-box-containing protein